MSIALIFHGTTDKGFDSFGNDDFSSYSRFYTGVGENNLLIEVFFNKKISYYTYIRRENFYSKAGRSGSYFAMTLSIEGQYCRDNNNLYNLFDSIYNKYVLNAIVSSNEAKEVYMVGSFDEVKNELIKIKEKFLQTFETSFKNDLRDIDENFKTKNDNQIAKFNLNDVDCPAFFEELYLYSKIRISKFYQSKNEKIRDYEQLVENEKKKIQECSNEITNLNTNYSRTISELNNKIKSLESEKNRLATECEKSKNKKNMEDSILRLISSLDENKKLIQKSYPRLQYGNENATEKWYDRKYISCVIVLLLVVLFILNVFMCRSIMHENALLSATAPTSITYESTTQSTCPPIENTEKNGQTAIPMPEGRIDFKEYKGSGPLDKTQTYNVEFIFEGDTFYDNISWKLDGFDRIDGNGNAKTIVVQPSKDKNDAHISFFVNGEQIKSRDFEIK